MGKRLHGESKQPTPEYRAWRDMRARCNDENHAAFPRYGGRGIFVSAAWDTFEAFLRDMGRRPSSEHSLERKDNNKSYSKENCIWATRAEQQDNTKLTRRLTYRGKTQSISKWAKELDLPRATLFSRLREGWSVDRALSTSRKTST